MSSYESIEVQKVEHLITDDGEHKLVILRKDGERVIVNLSGGGVAGISSAELEAVAAALTEHETATIAHGVDTEDLLRSLSLGYAVGRMESPPRLGLSGNTPIVNGVVFLTYLDPQHSMNVSFLQHIVNSNNAGATLTRLGFYGVNPDKSLDLLGQSANVAGLAMTGGDGEVYEAPLVAGGGLPAVVPTVRGARYARAIISVGQTTAGKLRGGFTGKSSRWNPILCRQALGPYADLPAHIDAAALSDLTALPYQAASTAAQL